MDFSIEQQPKEEKMRQFKPIPKPRRSLMINTSNVPLPPSTTTVDVINSQALAESKSRLLYNNNNSPPPLPPRSAIFSPLPPRTLPASLQENNRNNNFTTENISSQNGANKIYPKLENFANNKKLFPSPESIVTAKKYNSMDFVASNSSSSSYFSSSNDSHLNAVAATSTTTTLKSSLLSSPLYESIGNVKSDGESVCFSGWVTVLPQGIIKHRKRGWALIRQHQFTISNNEESAHPFFGPYDVGKCVYLGRTAIQGNNSDEISLIFRVCSSNGKSSHKQQQPLNDESILVLRILPEENGKFWLPLLAKCCSPRNDLFGDSISLLDCCGRLCIKQGITGLWNEGWAFVTSLRVLHFWVLGPNILTEVDIRKIIFIKHKEIPIADWCNRIENSSLGPILISLEGSSLYLQAFNDHCTEIWLDLLNAELRQEVKALEDCRLTSDDVPVIVDKCIRLITTYGLYQQGIYRKSGAAVEIKKIMQSFNEDPYSVYLKSPITDETIFAVASVLRTFFRQLSRPLIPASLHSRLFEISAMTEHSDEKAHFYRQLISSLPPVYFKTIRKLLGHLQEVITHENRNLASLDNISKIFGPTIFNVSSTEQEISVDSYTLATKQTCVMRDLIFHYCDIFDISADELLAKCKLDLMQEQKSSKNPATGLLLSIHLFEKDNKCFNIQSEWTAGQVVAFKTEKLALVSLCESYALFEMLREGQLERRIGANESLKSIVLGRWLEWGDFQGNFLLLKLDSRPFQPQSGRAFADELKVAEPGSKSFKHSSLRIEGGTRVCHYSKSLKKLNEWKVEEMVWFVGSEAERRPPLPFALTFFVNGEKKGAAAKCRGKLPGYCVAFKDEVQRHQWLNCICLNQSEYLPQPLIQI